jgi:DNA/RNA endonuclease YhcR with UshA esterase domain
MKISDLKPGQKVIIKGMLAEYKGIQKVKISNFAKADKRVFQAEEINIYIYYGLSDGSKTLKSEKIRLI